MLSLKLSKDVSKRSKAKEKGKNEKKRLRITQLNDEDVFWVSLFTGDGSKTDESESREIKVREAGEQGTESGRLSPPSLTTKDRDRRNVIEWFSLYLSSCYIFWSSQITHIYQNPNRAFRIYSIPTLTNLFLGFYFPNYHFNTKLRPSFYCRDFIAAIDFLGKEEMFIITRG